MIGTREARGRRSWRANPKYGMTAVILDAEARLAASTITSISMRFSDAGGQVGCTINVSRPRIFSRISTLISPSEKRPTWARASGSIR